MVLGIEDQNTKVSLALEKLVLSKKKLVDNTKQQQKHKLLSPSKNFAIVVKLFFKYRIDFLV
jgi:hypothetical protein